MLVEQDKANVLPTTLEEQKTVELMNTNGSVKVENSRQDPGKGREDQERKEEG